MYRRKCRAPICWNEVGEKYIEGPELVRIANEKVVVAKQKIKEAQSRQKSYADKHKRVLEFQPRDHVFLKVSPVKGMKRFGLRGKLNPRYIRSFQILDRVCKVAYRLALPPQLSHIHNMFHVSTLRGYNYHPLHVVEYLLERVEEDLTYVEEPKEILNRDIRELRGRKIPFVRVLWKNQDDQEAT